MKFRKFSCQICNKTFSSKNGLYKHHKTKHDESNPNKCKICLKVFPTNHHLDMHRRVHTGEKTHVCSTCGKGFTTKGNLQTHQTTHSDERKHKCDICTGGRFFKTKSQLSHHRKLHFDPEHQCTQCGKKFYTSSNLNRHT